MGWFGKRKPLWGAGLTRDHRLPTSYLRSFGETLGREEPVNYFPGIQTRPELGIHL